MSDVTEIKCPHCGTAFTIDGAGYADILSQVRDEAFQKSVHERLEIAAREQASAVAMAEAASKAEIERLKEALKASSQIAEAKVTGEFKDQSAKKDAEIARLKAELSEAAVKQQLVLREAVGGVEKERDDLRRDLQAKDVEHELKESSLKTTYDTQLKDRDAEIERLRDLKARLSTKMVGETLEQHCEIEFNRVRSLGFPHAHFGKDNEASGGTKGDYILRDYSDDGIEYISIMFEMKNESDTTATKKKNSDFFAKLDKDRNEKGCEYAVLVSLLEADSELYAGITDVSHEYPKMFVVRPQFFLAIIALLRNAAQATIAVKAELEQTKQQNIDITNFEAELTAFQSGFDGNVRNYKAKYHEAIDEIDKAIARLEKVKEALRLSGTHLDRANNKVDGLSIKKLTRGNPTMAAKFAALDSAEPDSE